MSNLSYSVVNFENLPVDTNEALENEADLNYIFYPGISRYRQINLVNNTETVYPVALSFTEDKHDSKWYKTLRIAETEGASGTLTWSGNVAAKSSQALWVYSDCTKQGWSENYDTSYWSQSGLTAFDGTKVNDLLEKDTAFTIESAASGSFLILDTETGKDYTFIKIATEPLVNCSGVFNINYSDNGTDWSIAYTGLDTGYIVPESGYMPVIWTKWNSVGAHRYWELEKTDAVNAASSGGFNEVQFNLFDVHEGREYGVYGKHYATMVDASGNLPDFDWNSEVSIVFDIFARQNNRLPTGKIGKRTKDIEDRIAKYGETYQIFYIAQQTFESNWDAKNDFQQEFRYWNVKAIVAPHRRYLTYKYGNTSAISAEQWGYDQRNIYLSPYGPDGVGWYNMNADYDRTYGHSWFILINDVCYKMDDPQFVYVGNEVAFLAARVFTQSDLRTVAGNEKRDYLLTVYRTSETQRLPNPIFVLPTGYVNPNTPDQNTVRMLTSQIKKRYGRKQSCRPNPYEFTATLNPSGTYTGEVYETEIWHNPGSANFQTNTPAGFFLDVKNAVAEYRGFQLTQFNNWWGICNTGANIDMVKNLVTCYYDEDCLIPVRLNDQSYYTSGIPKIEKYIDPAYIDAVGKCTLTALGNTCYIDGHLAPTPTRLYVKYRWDDGLTVYM